MFRRVAIIGGGATAAALFSELLERRTTQPLHLDWYTGGGRAPRGIAYGTDSPHHLLNVRAATMGMFSSHPQGFLEYAQQRDPSVGGTDFLPRRWYGDYLEAKVANALEQAHAQQVDVHVMPFRVEALVPEQDGVVVLQGEEGRRVDAAVLALGALAPRPLDGVTAEALAGGCYIVDPWPLLAQAQPDPTPRHVVLIGQGLTAADVLVDLAERWPNARFTAISRHGRLPEAHLPATSVPADDGAELLETLQLDPTIRHWMRQLREAVAGSHEWRTVIDGLRPHVPHLWAMLPLPERARFMRHARWAWERVRHRLPPPVSDALGALERSGRLQRRRGRIHSVHTHGDGLQLTLAPRDGCATTIDADLVIQATGLDTDIARCQDPLVRQLVTNGHVIPDPLGLGMQATADGHLLHDGKPWPHLFALGSLLRGALWESISMPEIHQQARNLALHLLAEPDTQRRARLA